MIVSRCWPLIRIVSAISRCCGVELGRAPSRSDMPMIAFIGVRISWLMLARKSDLAWVAASAATLARSSSASARLRSMNCPT